MSIPNSTKSLTFLFAIVLLFGFVRPIFAQDDEPIILESNLVVLNATVTDKTGATVSRLLPEQFSVFEDGEQQEIAFFENPKTPFAATILIDTSGSMETRVSLARAAAIKFLEGMRGTDFAAVYNFDSKPTLIQDFSNIRNLSFRTFDLEANGWTSLYDAILEASSALSKRTEKRRAIVVLSDGADTRSRSSADKALKAAIAADATIYTVDMSGMDTGARERMQNQDVLKKFAEKTGGRFVKTPGGVEMRTAFEKIVNELGSQYTLGYYPKNLKKDGKWRKISLKHSDPTLTIRTREGYNAPKN